MIKKKILRNKIQKLIFYIYVATALSVHFQSLKLDTFVRGNLTWYSLSVALSFCEANGFFLTTIQLYSKPCNLLIRQKGVFFLYIFCGKSISSIQSKYFSDASGAIFFFHTPEKKNSSIKFTGQSLYLFVRYMCFVRCSTYSASRWKI